MYYILASKQKRSLVVTVNNTVIMYSSQYLPCSNNVYFILLVTCPSLSIINGMMKCLMGDNTYEDTCSFTCDTGYELTGSDTRTCQSDGSWSGTRVSCDIMKCPILSLPLDSVLPEACNNTYQSICELQCSEGFNGTGNSSYMCDVTGSSIMWRPLGDVWTCVGGNIGSMLT